MLLYITDNLLRVERAIRMSDMSYCPAREDGIASIEYSENTVKLLVVHRINFIIELPYGTDVPKYVQLVAHPDNSLLGVNWYIPVYWKPEVAHYDVEYKTESGEYKYKDKVSLSAFTKGVESGFRITRVFSENGLTKEFLAKFDMKIYVRGKFRYAAPNKKGK